MFDLNTRRVFGVVPTHSSMDSRFAWSWTKHVKHAVDRAVLGNLFCSCRDGRNPFPSWFSTASSGRSLGFNVRLHGALLHRLIRRFADKRVPVQPKIEFCGIGTA